MFRRRGCLSGCLNGCLSFILFICLIVGVWYFGTYTIKTTEVTVESSKINDPVTFVQITDLHGSSFGSDNEKLVNKIMGAHPDFVVATGDMYTNGDSEGEDTAVALLHRLAELYPVYFVHGEHDNSETFEDRLEAGGVDVLEYEHRDINVGNSSVRLYGITNVYYTPTFNLKNAFVLDRSKYNILAAHIANAGAFADFGLDLSVCGDTHGGQVRLPYYGAVYNQGEWLPETKEGDVSYTKGLYNLGSSKLFISSGLGNYPLPVRFLNRPEIAVIHITGENN